MCFQITFGDSNCCSLIDLQKFQAQNPKKHTHTHTHTQIKPWHAIENLHKHKKTSNMFGCDTPYMKVFGCLVHVYGQQ